MRSFLRFVVFVGVLVAVLALVVGPLVARPLIASLVRDALPFDDESVTVAVGVGPALLAGEVETVDVGGRDLQAGEATIGLLEIAITGFTVVDRSFKDIDGRLEDVHVRLEDGTALSITLIELSGTSEALQATVMLDALAVEQLVRSKLAEHGIVPDAVRLGHGTIEVDAQGLTVAAVIRADEDGLFLVPERLLPPIPVIEPSESDTWLITSASVSPSGLVVEATTDMEALLDG